jgi:hypothetical protein
VPEIHNLVAMTANLTQRTHNTLNSLLDVDPVSLYLDISHQLLNFFEQLPTIRVLGIINQIVNVISQSVDTLDNLQMILAHRTYHVSTKVMK